MMVAAVNLGSGVIDLGQRVCFWACQLLCSAYRVLALPGLGRLTTGPVLGVLSAPTSSGHTQWAPRRGLNAQRPESPPKRRVPVPGSPTHCLQAAEPSKATVAWKGPQARGPRMQHKRGLLCWVLPRTSYFSGWISFPRTLSRRAEERKYTPCLDLSLCPFTTDPNRSPEA